MTFRLADRNVVRVVMVVVVSVVGIVREIMVVCVSVYSIVFSIVFVTVLRTEHFPDVASVAIVVYSVDVSASITVTKMVVVIYVFGSEIVVEIDER